MNATSSKNVTAKICSIIPHVNCSSSISWREVITWTAYVICTLERVCTIIFIESVCRKGCTFNYSVIPITTAISCISAERIISYKTCCQINWWISCCSITFSFSNNFNCSVLRAEICVLIVWRLAESAWYCAASCDTSPPSTPSCTFNWLSWVDIDVSWTFNCVSCPLIFNVLMVGLKTNFTANV